MCITSVTSTPSSTLFRRSAAGSVALLAALLSACASAPSGPPPPASTGAAGGGTAVGADSALQTCAEPVGTVRLQDGQASADTRATETASNETIQSLRLLLKDWQGFRSGKDNKAAEEGMTIEALRLLIQQSNCLVILDRGVAEAAASDEKRRTAGNTAVRDDANMGPGQEVAADFVLRSMVLSIGEESSSGFNVGKLIPLKFVQGMTGNQQTIAANVQLVLSDVRTKAQLAVAQGNGSGKNTGLATSVLGRFGGGQIGTQSKTAASTVLLQAFADAYNKMVPALRNYKTQTVQGGLGAGGTLRVQGARTDASAVPK